MRKICFGAASRHCGRPRHGACRRAARGSAGWLRCQSVSRAGRRLPHGSAPAPIRMGSMARAWPPTAALPATGAVRGVIAAIRPITAGSPAVAGNDSRTAARSIFRPRGSQPAMRRVRRIASLIQSRSASCPIELAVRTRSDSLSSHILPVSGTMIGVCTTLIGLVKFATAQARHVACRRICGTGCRDVSGECDDLLLCRSAGRIERNSASASSGWPIRFSFAAWSVSRSSRPVRLRSDLSFLFACAKVGVADHVRAQESRARSFDGEIMFLN